MVDSCLIISSCPTASLSVANADIFIPSIDFLFCSSGSKSVSSDSSQTKTKTVKKFFFIINLTQNTFLQT